MKLKTKAFKSNFTRAFGKASLGLKKRSPEILIVAGVAGVITSTVMACKATTKLNDVIDDAKDQIDMIHSAIEGDVKTTEEYTAEDGKKDLAIVYTQTAVKVIKLYGPAVLIGVASIASILASNNILRKRNVALAAAYATVDRSFKEYRGRVVDRFGKELDKELKYGVKATEVDKIVIDENGNEKVEKEIINVATGIGSEYSDYARIWDEGNPGWTKDPEFNLMYLKRQQDYANEKLRSKGYLFLNDVYDLLGFQRSKAGQSVGWIYDETRPETDGFVDFGIYDIYTVSPLQAERKAAFVNGYERSIVLDFNVDGDILSMF